VSGEYEEIIFLLTPPERLEGRVRKGILEYGIKLTSQGDIQCSAILAKDRYAFNLPPNLDVHEKGGCFGTVTLLTAKKSSTGFEIAS
jgi:hypothetical protein